MTAAASATKRSITGRLWQYRNADDRISSDIARRAGVSNVLARLLAGRGMAAVEAEAWLAGGTPLEPPVIDQLCDLRPATELLADALARGTKVGVFGDYDVDGSASTAQLVRFLRTVGEPPAVYIPDRLRDGYGPNARAIDWFRSNGVELLVTVDCGTTAFAALEHAAAHGLEVIVVDHHVAESALPPAAAVVNPNRVDDSSGLHGLTSSGLVWVLLKCLREELLARGVGRAAEIPDPEALLDLAALGTVCDVAPLTGPNRWLVRHGLAAMGREARPGLRAIANAAGLEEPPHATHLGFVYGPRINAAGRVGDAALGLRILETDDPQEAARIAAQLEQWNLQRRSLEGQAYDEAVDQAEAAQSDQPSVVVVEGAAWHPGVIGIVASRIAARFRRPAAVCARDGTLVRGSARSFGSIDIGGAVIRARKAGLLLSGGGHPMAAGFTARADRFGDLVRFLNADVAARGDPDGIEESLLLDGVLAVSGANVALGVELESAGPFGKGNPHPCYALHRVFPVHPRIVGSGHVSCLLADETRGRVKAIAFRSQGTPIGNALLKGQPLDVAGQVHVSTWRGRTRAEVHIQDVARCRR